MRNMKAIVVVATTTLLLGCAAQATLYPANDAAHSLGVLHANMTEYGTGSGPFSVTMPDGEVLTGRYSVNVGGSMNFGTLYGSVYGSGGSATGSAFSSSSSMDTSSPAIADAAGPHGTTIHCEAYNNNITGHGNGACETSTGARYRLQY